MRSRKRYSTPKDPTSKTPGSSSSSEPPLGPPEGPSDGGGSSYSINPTRGSYMELHGDVHKGQEPPEEKD